MVDDDERKIKEQLRRLNVSEYRKKNQINKTR